MDLAFTDRFIYKRKKNSNYRVAQEKYSSLRQYNLKSKRALTLKKEGLYSVMSNLNFGIYHVHFNTVLTEITALNLS